MTQAKTRGVFSISSGIATAPSLLCFAPGRHDFKYRPKIKELSETCMALFPTGTREWLLAEIYIALREDITIEKADYTKSLPHNLLADVLCLLSRELRSPNFKSSDEGMLTVLATHLDTLRQYKGRTLVIDRLSPKNRRARLWELDLSNPSSRMTMTLEGPISEILHILEI